MVAARDGKVLLPAPAVVAVGGGGGGGGGWGKAYCQDCPRL